MGPSTENVAHDGGPNGYHNGNTSDSDGDSHIRFVPLSYDSHDADASAFRLIYALRPEWQSSPDAEVELVRFTDGITNTLLKAVNKRPGLSKEEIDREAILLRAYGNGTDLIIDRQRERQNHELLMRHGLAPELLARFENGMMYRFLRGTVTHPEDLRRPGISRAIARRLAQWHATMPCLPGRTHIGPSLVATQADGGRGLQETVDNVAPGKPAPNLWTVMQKWILALPTVTEAQRRRQASLQAELGWLIARLSSRPGLGQNGLVFAHTDLLSGNVIVLPQETTPTTATAPSTAPPPCVAFIDYEYAVPSPAAFDIANHFAEWGGFDCDMATLPTRAQRRNFIAEYVRAYATFLRPSTSLASPPSPPAAAESNTDNTAANGSATNAQGDSGSCSPLFDPAAEEARLMREVDAFRGVPGFYWGVWSLIQATISEIDFDYAAYAETRLAEYWAWKAEELGTRPAGAELCLRERRWAQESDDEQDGVRAKAA